MVSSAAAELNTAQHKPPSSAKMKLCFIGRSRAEHGSARIDDPLEVSSAAAELNTAQPNLPTFGLVSRRFIGRSRAEHGSARQLQPQPGKSLSALVSSAAAELNTAQPTRWKTVTQAVNISCTSPRSA